VATLPAHLVATPVLERLAGEGRGTVLGAGATAAWVDLDGFVVAVTTREVPLLPNAIALAGSGALAGAAAGPGATARLGPGRVTLGNLQVTWDPAAPPSWDPTVPVPTGVTRRAVGARAAALLRALRAGAVDDHLNRLPRSATLPHRGAVQPAGAEAHARDRAQRPEQAPEPTRELVRELARIGLVTAADPEGADGLTWLFRAVGERDPEPAAAAVRALAGRGPGLTPEGDDLLAAVAGTLAVLGPAVSPPDPPWEPLLAVLGPRPGRTTALSATLLALALDRRLPEPAGRLLDLGPAGERAWPAALTRLERLGHGSGRAYAAGIAATASLLAAGAPARR
jgi:Protein of unknown function (DUF2877)